jgi:hypothetical protein
VRSLGFALLLVVVAPAHAEDGWKTFETDKGVTYEKRPVPGSHFNEYRAVMAVTATPTDTARTVWTAITDAIPPTVKKRQVLSRGTDEILIYDQIHTPVVSDRDVTIRIRRITHADSVEVRFESANELGPPPAPGYVRLPVVRGRWMLTPSDGGTHVVYECYSEPGGSIPAFLVRGAQQSEVAKDVERVLSRLGGAR